MKSIRTYHILFLIFFIHALGSSQEKKRKATNDNFDAYAYMVPIESYESLLKKGYNESIIYKKLGNQNFLSANYDVATYWYEKLVNLNETDIEPDYLYRYSLSLKSIKKYEEANLWMEKFRKAKNQDLRAGLYALNTDYLKDITIPTDQYTIENFSSINSSESDFAPSYLLENIVFATTRDLESEADYNDLVYSNLYKAEFTENKESVSLKKFSENINTKANESSTAFSTDGKTVYFTRNNFEKNNFKRDKNGISRLKIYTASFEADAWTNEIELPFNSTDYSVAHPSLNSTGTKLYFVSDMPGGKGASDIYVVDVLADGSYGIPQNLGAPINTEGKETFPFISESETLYFASDGHPGLGGLDLFKVSLKDKKSIHNLGSPINSSEDDFSIVMDAAEENGFFASNRNGGQGSDDIYRLALRKNECFTFINGIAVDKDSDTPLAETNIIAYNNDGEEIAQSQTTSDGTYTIRIPCQEKQYQLTGTKEGYEDGSLFMLTSPEEKQINATQLKLEESSKVANVGSDLVKILKLTPIYFDLNSSYIRTDAYAELDKVIDYMLRRPEVIIEVGSHTDSREQDNYNLWLSERRAKRTVEYILSKGISTDRITGKGYGETQLTNHCRNGMPCSDKDHQLNRRSEFIVIEK
ncbi:OmpA family protein [Aurantibacter crassamenti]|uniref:OmpA family protein n=1 Tax=Aurantibacter crassamenti TaxID=1837375 RepID=UPI00193AB1C7|nr:OmpA family protein [Aurantibacter crassamenti]MBM1106427.1 OmpA family protein [Aurantibacter crassamenti]